MASEPSPSAREDIGKGSDGVRKPYAARLLAPRLAAAEKKAGKSGSKPVLEI